MHEIFWIVLVCLTCMAIAGLLTARAVGLI